MFEIIFYGESEKTGLELRRAIKSDEKNIDFILELLDQIEIF
jgi:hypothetical protein